MTDCLVVSPAALEFAEEIARTADVPVALDACVSVEEARDKYSGQLVLLGAPDMVATLLLELPAIAWVQSTWAGVKPLSAIRRRDYILTGVKGVFGPQISEYVFAYLLAHELKVVERMEQQRQRNWFPAASGVLLGKRIGVMGTGSIGSHIAGTARTFGQTVTGLNTTGAPSADFDEVYPVARLQEFLEGLDYLVSTLPQTGATANLLDKTALARLPAHAYFINVGRGDVVDDTALVEALRHDELGGATLDVFDEEPLPKGSPLWDTPGLTVTAHIAALSHPSLIVPIFLENYRRYRTGEPLMYEIDLDRGY